MVNDQQHQQASNINIDRKRPAGMDLLEGGMEGLSESDLLWVVAGDKDKGNEGTRIKSVEPIVPVEPIAKPIKNP
jgi:hypothetical protein